MMVKRSAPPQHILISHVYSADNKGDAALLSVLISELGVAFPEATLKIHTLDDLESHETFDGVPVANSLMHHVLSGSRSRVSKLIGALAMVAWTSVWASTIARTKLRLPLPLAWQRVIDDYVAADLVVAVGGGYLRGRRSWASTVELLLLTHPLHLARSLDTPTVLSSMSVGPFSGTAQRRLFVRAVNQVEAIFVREEVSRELLASLGVTVPVIRSIDSGFAFTSNATVPLRQLLKVTPNQLLVGITVRKWLAGPQQEVYERAIAAGADHLINTYGAAVVFVPQVTSVRNNDDDRVASTNVHALMKGQDAATVWTESNDHHYIKAMFSEFDLLIGTRFHSVIFALTAFVPAVAIDYEHKTRGIMADLGLSEWVLRIEDVTDRRLIEVVNRLISDRGAYVQHLHNVVPPYVERSADTISQFTRLSRYSVN